MHRQVKRTAELAEISANNQAVAKRANPGQPQPPTATTQQFYAVAPSPPPAAAAAYATDTYAAAPLPVAAPLPMAAPLPAAPPLWDTVPPGAVLAAYLPAPLKTAAPAAPPLWDLPPAAYPAAIPAGAVDSAVPTDMLLSAEALLHDD